MSPKPHIFSFLFSAATVLDPRIKEQGFINNSKYLHACNFIREELKKQVNLEMAKDTGTSEGRKSNEKVAKDDRFVPGKKRY